MTSANSNAPTNAWLLVESFVEVANLADRVDTEISERKECS